MNEYIIGAIVILIILWIYCVIKLFIGLHRWRKQMEQHKEEMKKLGFFND